MEFFVHFLYTKIISCFYSKHTNIANDALYSFEVDHSQPVWSDHQTSQEQNLSISFMSRILALKPENSEENQWRQHCSGGTL